MCWRAPSFVVHCDEGAEKQGVIRRHYCFAAQLAGGYRPSAGDHHEREEKGDVGDGAYDVTRILGVRQSLAIYSKLGFVREFECETQPLDEEASDDDLVDRVQNSAAKKPGDCAGKEERKEEVGAKNKAENFNHSLPVVGHMAPSEGERTGVVGEPHVVRHVQQGGIAGDVYNVPAQNVTKMKRGKSGNAYQ